MWNVGTSRITTPWLRRRSQFSNYRWDFDLRSSTRLVFIWEKCTTGWKLYKEGLINMEIFVSFHPLQIGQDKPFRNAPCKSKSHCSSYKQTTWMIIILPFPGVERSWRNCRRDWTASVLLWLQKKISNCWRPCFLDPDVEIRHWFLTGSHSLTAHHSRENASMDVFHSANYWNAKFKTWID